MVVTFLSASLLLKFSHIILTVHILQYGALPRTFGLCPGSSCIVLSIHTSVVHTASPSESLEPILATFGKDTEYVLATHPGH